MNVHTTCTSLYCPLCAPPITDSPDLNDMFNSEARAELGLTKASETESRQGCAEENLDDVTPRVSIQPKIIAASNIPESLPLSLWCGIWPNAALN